MIRGVLNKLKNNRFNDITFKNKKDFLINNIMYKSEGTVDRELAEHIVSQLDISKQYYVKVVPGMYFDDECCLVNLTVEQDGKVVERELQSGYSVEGVCEFGKMNRKRNLTTTETFIQVLEDIGGVNCLAIVKVTNKFGIIDLNEDNIEFNTSKIIYDLIVKEGR